MPYTTVIGLEVHVQLLTASKLFCGCANRFGAPPNTLTCPVCIGMPGVLPVMNRRAFELALKAAVALNCDISPFTKWDRKNYYYPDLPKNYQISQYDLPFSHDGYVEFSVEQDEQPRRIGIIRVHLEEDAGKMLHDESAQSADSRVDLNRTGTPLLEIVSMPDLRSPAEAHRYLEELKLLLTYLGVSDCNMQEGSLRVDANVNLHVHDGDQAIPTPIVEVKNMNSFRAVERALAFEADRQFQEFQRTGHKLGDVPKETRGWDETREMTVPQRSKEEASDYRYFPEPDLAPVVVDEAWLAQVKAAIGEPPAERRYRFQVEYDIPAYDADVIINQGPALADYFETVARTSGDGKMASNWIMQDVLRILNEQKTSIEAFPVPAASLGELLESAKSGRISTAIGREVFAEMLGSGKAPAAIIAERGLEQISDSSDLEPVIDQVLADQQQALRDLDNPKKQKQVIGYLTGQVMRATGGKANPTLVRELLEKRLVDRG